MNPQQVRALVYLDHSRFSKISSALDLSIDMGNAEHDRTTYRQIFELLLELVRADRIVVPVSYWHICETVRWPAGILKAGYCSVVEKLSQGLAVRFWTEAYSMLLRGELLEPTGVVLDCFPAHHRAELARAGGDGGESLTFTRAVDLCAGSGLPIVENFMHDQVNKFAGYVKRIQDGKSLRVLPGKANGEPLSFNELVCNEAFQFIAMVAKTAQPGYDAARVLRDEQQDDVVLLGAKRDIDDFFQRRGLSDIASTPPKQLVKRLGEMAGFSAVVCGVAESKVTAETLRRSPQNTFDLLHMSYLGLCKYHFMEAKFTQYGAKAASCTDTFLEHRPQKFLEKLKADFG